MQEIIQQGDLLLAMIIRADTTCSGITFCTESHFSQQMGLMCHPTGHQIPPHVHMVVPREVTMTQEALFVRRGRVRVDFYDRDEQYLTSRELNALDVILLIDGGHGFEILDDAEIIEIKQGPYMGDQDKRRFIAKGHP